MSEMHVMHLNCFDADICLSQGHLEYCRGEGHDTCVLLLHRKGNSNIFVRMGAKILARNIMDQLDSSLATGGPRPAMELMYIAIRSSPVHLIGPHRP